MRIDLTGAYELEGSRLMRIGVTREYGSKVR
jgi:hypothetical protein